MPADYELVAARLAEIEAEMKAAGFWQPHPLPPAAYQFTQAFGMDTMAFSQWLQFVFIPRVNAVIQQRGPLPTHSMVGAQAVREFDGVPEADRLVALLAEFDALFR